MRRSGGIFAVVSLLSAALVAPMSPSVQPPAAAAAVTSQVATAKLSSGALVGAASSRIAGSTPSATSVAVSRAKFTDPAKVSRVYLASSSASLEGLAGGSLTKGPVLLVPSGCAAVPAEVVAEVKRLGPWEVTALNTTSKVCDAQLSAAAGGRRTARMSGWAVATRVASIAQEAFPSGARTVYLVKGKVSAEALAAGQLKDGPILALNSDGSVPSVTAKTITTLNPTKVVALGSASSVPDAALTEAAQGRATERLSGADTFQTVTRIAARAFPSRTHRLYLGRSSYDHAQAATMLTDGPIVLASSAAGTALPAHTRSFVRSRTPGNVVAVEPSNRITESTLVGAAKAARGAVNCGVTRCVALTFDDGPGTSTTTSILDTLAKERVPATFFTLGNRVDVYPSTAVREHVEGNVVANHSWSHPQLNTLSYSAQKSQIDSTSAEIASHGIPRPTMVRPPYGAYNANTRALGYPLILWDVDPEDWKSLTSAEVHRRVMANTRNGSIVLMHDIHARTASALPSIVRDLKAQGYTLVTVPELTSMKAGDLVYRRGMVYSLATALSSDMTVRTPDGRNLGLVLDEAPVPGLAPRLTVEELTATP